MFCDMVGALVGCFSYQLGTQLASCVCWKFETCTNFGVRAVRVGGDKSYIVMMSRSTQKWPIQHHRANIPNWYSNM